MQDERDFENQDKVNKTNAFVVANSILLDEIHQKKVTEKRLKAIEKV